MSVVGMKMIRVTLEVKPSFGMIGRILKAIIIDNNMSLSVDMTEHNIKQMMNRINSDNPIPSDPGTERIPFSK